MFSLDTSTLFGFLLKPVIVVRPALLFRFGLNVAKKSEDPPPVYYVWLNIVYKSRSCPSSSCLILGDGWNLKSASCSSSLSKTSSNLGLIGLGVLPDLRSTMRLPLRLLKPYLLLMLLNWLFYFNSRLRAMCFSSSLTSPSVLFRFYFSTSGS